MKYNKTLIESARLSWNELCVWFDNEEQCIDDEQEWIDHYKPLMEKLFLEEVDV